MTETPDEFMASAVKMYVDARLTSGLTEFQIRLLMQSQMICEPCLLAHGHQVMASMKAGVHWACEPCSREEWGGNLSDVLVLCTECYERTGPQLCPHGVASTMSEPVELRYDVDAAMEVITDLITNVSSPLELEEYMRAKRAEQ